MIVVDAVERAQVTVTVNIQRMKRKIAFDKCGGSESIHMCYLFTSLGIWW